MFGYNTIALLAVLAGELVVGSPLQKRFSNSVIQSGRNGQCLSLPAGTAPSNGVTLVTANCNTATRWDINPGSGSVIVSGTNFALDAGVPQGNNAIAKVWQSYPGSQQQTWYLTADNRIAVTGGNQCLDQGDNGPQTYQCTPGNTNQGMSMFLTAVRADLQSGLSEAPPLPRAQVHLRLLRLPPLVDNFSSAQIEACALPYKAGTPVTASLSICRTATLPSVPKGGISWVTV
jgi:hypothetical protein